MWNETTRKKYDRRYQIYPSDINDEEWKVLESMLPVEQSTGRPRVHSVREIINGIRYVQRYGIPWDAMPKDLPHTVSAMIIGEFWLIRGAFSI